MNDINKKAKMNVLQQIIDMMEDKELNNLKGKSPKFMKVETNDPEMAKQVVEEVIPDESEQDLSKLKEENSDESPILEEKSEDEDLERLKELYAKLK